MRTKTVGNHFSAADEIKKLKGLLDSHVITQEEYDQKKAKLLDVNPPPSEPINLNPAAPSSAAPNPVPLNPAAPPKPKKKHYGCLVALLIFLAMSGIITFIGNQIDMSTPVVFDAKRFIGEDGEPLGEQEVIEMLGEPDSIDEWNYKALTASYPMRTLVYGNYEYSFNNDILQRININESFPYSKKEDILEMFGL